MAKYQTSCGQDSCLCSFLFLDFELTSAWCNTGRQYLDLAKKPFKDVTPKQLLQPWKFATLSEHELCFQQWNVLQLWVGVVSALVIFVMNLVWFLAEDNELAKPSMGNILVNAFVGIFLSFFFAHLAWFGVMKKHGCCCLLLCCCLGKPNLLATAILYVLFGALTILAAVPALGSAHGALVIVVLIGALFALVHGVTLLYVGFEAFMIWRVSTPEKAVVGSDAKQAGSDSTVVGVPQVSSGPAVDIEAVGTKAEQ